jgi:hypothetical protein
MGVLQAVKAAACAGENLCFPPGIVPMTPCLARHRANPGTGTRRMTYTDLLTRGAVTPRLMMMTV